MQPAISQTKSFDDTVQSIKDDLLAYRNSEAVQKIDSILVCQITPENEITLKTLKIKALVEAELFEDALTLSYKVLNEPKLDIVNKVKVLINRSLLYEILEKFPEAEKELEKVERLYSNTQLPKDESYAVYLYRKSSLYRVQKKDTLALKYAILAKDFSHSNNFENSGAVSNMLLGFLTDSNQVAKRIFYFNDALKLWKSLEDWHGMGAMYHAIAKTYKLNNETVLSLKYCDSAIFVATPVGDYPLLAESYKIKSGVYENIKEYDSALVNFKKYQELDKTYSLIKKDIKISQLDFQYKIDKENIQKSLLEDDLKKANSYSQNLTVLICILLIVICVVAFLLRKLFKKNNRINKQKEEINTSHRELEISVNEKEILLKELHHRVKNNLSMILSLVMFQMNDLEDDRLKHHFTILENRIRAIAIAHEQFMYNSDSGKNESYNLKDYLLKIIHSLLDLHSKKIELEYDIKNYIVSLDTAMPLGILINELVSNTIKHAVRENGNIKIYLEVMEKDQQMEIRYMDNGTFFKQKAEDSSLGLVIIDMMVTQLNGNFTRNESKYVINIDKK